MSQLNITEWLRHAGEVEASCDITATNPSFSRKSLPVIAPNASSPLSDWGLGVAVITPFSKLLSGVPMAACIAVDTVGTPLQTTDVGCIELPNS